MPWLPVAERELRTAARSKKYRRARLITAMGAVLLLGWLLLAGGGITGREVFEILSAIAFVYCLFTGAAHTADCLSEEKRDNTLGLLFLTTLKGYDVVLGKLLANSLHCFFGLLAMLPVLATPLILGGVLYFDFWCVGLNLINTLFFSLAAGLFISAVSRRQVRALTLALGVVLVFSFGLSGVSELLKNYYHRPRLAVAVGLFSPFNNYLLIFESIAWRRHDYFWWSLFTTHLMAWAWLGAASWISPRVWKERPGGTLRQRWQARWHAWNFGGAGARRAFRHRLLASNPFYWLAARERVSSFGFLVLALFVVALAIWAGRRMGALMGGPSKPLIGYLFAWFWAALALHGCLLFKVAHDASRRLGEDRASGALELLLSTPLSVGQILRGQWRALLRQLAGPALAVAVVHAIFLWGMLMMFNLEEGTKLSLMEILRQFALHGFAGAGDIRMEFIFMVLMILAAGLLLVLHWISLGWVGMWLGLRLKRARHAPWLALWLVGIPPLIIFTTVMVAIEEMRLSWDQWGIVAFGFKLALGLSGLNDLILSLWAWNGLRRHFRYAATARFQPLQRSRRWVYVKRAGFGLAGAGALVVLFYAEESWRGQRAWARLQRQLASKGERFDLASIIPPPVPAEQNFAAAPMLAPLFDFEDTPQGRRRPQQDAYDQLLSLNLDGQIGSAVASSKLAQVSWKAQKLTDLEEWKKFYRGLTGFPKGATNQEPVAAVLQALGVYDVELDELRAASQRLEARFPITYERGNHAFLPHLAVLHNICDVLRLRAVAELATGQSEAAFQDVKLALYLAESVRREPLMFSHQARHAMLNSTLQPVWEGLAQHRWTDAHLIALQDAFKNMNLLADYAVAVRGQCVLEIEGWNVLLAVMAGNAPAGVNADDYGVELFRWLYPTGWVYQNKVSIHRFCHEKLLPVVDASQQRIFATQALEVFQVTPRQTFFRNWRDGHLFLNFGTAMPQVQTAVNQARIACALERHRVVHGQFPETLEALAPRYLDRLPHDIINGQPLNYRRIEGGSFVLYSLGWDQKDDGGGWPMDWVWKYPAK